MRQLEQEFVRTDDEDGTDRIVIRDAIFFEILRSVLRGIEFDETWYVHRYADVKEALKAGKISSAHEHFILFGYKEGRLPRHIVVDEEFYLSKYPDVARAVATGSFSNAQDHFNEFGAAEGRMPSPSFTLF